MLCTETKKLVIVGGTSTAPSAASRRHDKEARRVVAIVLNVGGYPLQGVDRSGGLGRDSGLGRITLMGDTGGSAGGVQYRGCYYVVCHQESPALAQRHGMTLRNSDVRQAGTRDSQVVGAV